MSIDSVSPKEAVQLLLQGGVPERVDDLTELWRRYPVAVHAQADAKYITMAASRHGIIFDFKTIDVFWVLGFSGWRAIECYAPAVYVSARCGSDIDMLLRDDSGLPVIEWEYKQRLAAAQALIESDVSQQTFWPTDVPQPCLREALTNDQDRTAFDLTGYATAFIFLHEFRHVMLDFDDERHADRREEELACDVWARDFMTAKLAAYAVSHSHNYNEVLQKRSMGFALAGLILHEVTPLISLGGNESYFSLKDRLQALLTGCPLPPESHYWTFAASLLVGVYRRRGEPILSQGRTPRELAEYLIQRM